ncbi:hypothetical protein ANCCAN_02455, partial [Ancylostoma caninum]
LASLVSLRFCNSFLTSFPEDGVLNDDQRTCVAGEFLPENCAYLNIFTTLLRVTCVRRLTKDLPMRMHVRGELVLA